MATSPPPSSEPTAQRVPYAQASPQQLSLALAYIQKELHNKFPTLKWSTWANTLLAVQPDLWVKKKTVYLDEQGLTLVAQYLAALPGVRDYASIVHGPRVVYLAKKLVYYQDDAIYALADIEANPLAYSLPVFQLVSSLAVGNAVAEEVYHATRLDPEGRPGGEDPELSRAAVHTRLQALRTARGMAG